MDTAWFCHQAGDIYFGIIAKNAFLRQRFIDFLDYCLLLLISLQNQQFLFITCNFDSLSKEIKIATRMRLDWMSSFVLVLIFLSDGDRQRPSLRTYTRTSVAFFVYAISQECLHVFNSHLLPRSILGMPRPQLIWWPWSHLHNNLKTI